MKVLHWIKMHKGGTVAIAIVLLLFAGYLKLILTPTGTINRLRYIYAEDFFSGEMLEIKYRTKGWPAGIATIFQLQQEGLDEIAQSVQMRYPGLYETEQYGEDALLIWKKESPAFYIIYRGKSYDDPLTKEKPVPNLFFMFNAAADLDEYKIPGVDIEFVFPCHFVPLEYWGNDLSFKFESDTRYETFYGKEDFLEFYRRLGRYEITETADGFLLMREASWEERGLPTPLRISFTQEDGKQYFQITQQQNEG